MKTVQNVTIKLAPGERDTLQESDLMDRLPDGAGASAVDVATEHIRLVSLGNDCGPKLSFKHLGRGAETLPFDWNRTRVEGLLHFMRNDFDGFFSFMTREPVPGIDRMVTYRDYLHSFWHDDPRDPGMQERYCRRIDRFHAIDAERQMVLFVRVAMLTSELGQAEELLAELTARFGRQAHLLIVLSQQTLAKGPGVIQAASNLMVHFLQPGAHNSNGFAVYAEPIRVALDWMVGRPVDAMVFPDVAYVQQVATEMLHGLTGLGGLPGFEEQPGAPPSAEAVDTATARLVAREREAAAAAKAKQS